MRGLAARLIELDDAESRAREKHEDVRERITPVPDVPRRPEAVRSVLDLIRERGRAPEQSWAVPDVVRCEQAIRCFREQIEEFEEELKELLDRRAELRGRLTAYKAREAGSGLAEKPELAVLFREAHELLYRGPCDLREAGKAVKRYQLALWGDLGYPPPFNGRAPLDDPGDDES